MPILRRRVMAIGILSRLGADRPLYVARPSRPRKTVCECGVPALIARARGGGLHGRDAPCHGETLPLFRKVGPESHGKIASERAGALHGDFLPASVGVGDLERR